MIRIKPNNVEDIIYENSVSPPFLCFNQFELPCIMVTKLIGIQTQIDEPAWLGRFRKPNYVAMFAIILIFKIINQPVALKFDFAQQML